DLEDLFLYSGKHNPEQYFNPQIRKGISFFSLFVNKDEIEKGMEKLKADIDSGKINDVIKSYENDLGDYLFVVGEKQIY
ncbi:MAG: class I SAM-dependent methyltransferase, partial [Ignavibacteriaceae bacterium]